MLFNIGDKVVVCSNEFPEQCGLTAQIIDYRAGSRLQWRVRYDANQQHHPYFNGRTKYTGGKTNSYSHEDLLALTGKVVLMSDPMFDLDDMEIAEKVMEEMK